MTSEAIDNTSSAAALLQEVDDAITDLYRYSGTLDSFGDHLMLIEDPSTSNPGAAVAVGVKLTSENLEQAIENLEGLHLKLKRELGVDK